MDYDIDSIAEVVGSKLSLEANRFAGKTLRILNIGVFPWHQLVEVSFLFEGEEVDDLDVASWPNFSAFVRLPEMPKWTQGEELGIAMHQVWQEENDYSCILIDFGTAAHSPIIQQALRNYHLSEYFELRIFDQDERPPERNYYEFVMD